MRMAAYDEQPAGSFTFHPTHGHLHFDDWVQLHLREVLPGNGVGEIVASGNKTSFAIIDLEPHDTALPGAPARIRLWRRSDAGDFGGLAGCVHAGRCRINGST